MGGVEVLYPQDPLQKRLNYRQVSFVNTAMKSKRNSSSNPNPNPNRGSGKSDRRKRSPQKNFSTDSCRKGGLDFSSSTPDTKAAKGNLIMGQVKILKRGEALTDAASLKEESKKIEEKDEAESCVEGLEKDFVLSTTGRLGPEPETMLKELKFVDFYAGSACVTSPPPSSLPVPAFFKKKNILLEGKDDATGDLRRLLRLDLY